jgi:hypothetical protein
MADQEDGKEKTLQEKQLDEFVDFCKTVCFVAPHFTGRALHDMPLSMR